MTAEVIDEQPENAGRDSKGRFQPGVSERLNFRTRRIGVSLRATFSQDGMRTGGRPLASRQSFWRFSASSRGTQPRSDEPQPAAEADRAAAVLVEWQAPLAPAAADRVAAVLVEWQAPLAPAAADRVAADRVAEPDRAVDRVAADRVAADRVAADRVAEPDRAVDRVAVDRVAADRAAADRVAADRVAADRVAEPDRAAVAADRAAVATDRAAAGVIRVSRQTRFRRTKQYFGTPVRPTVTHRRRCFTSVSVGRARAARRLFQETKR